MLLKHFSCKPIENIEDKEQSAEVGTFHKPKGLWISDEAAEFSWSKWCEVESWGIGKLKYLVELNDRANILFITNVDELVSFTLYYRAVKDYKTWVDFGIDWIRVAQTYQGIIVTPYIWECRLDSRTSWYYGWDCASGCIWDTSAIESIKLEELANA